MGKLKRRWEPTPEEVATIKDMAASGNSGAAIARAIKISDHTLSKWLKTNGIKTSYVQPSAAERRSMFCVPPCEIHASKEDPYWISPARRKFG
jgi:hypothetical protein